MIELNDFYNKGFGWICKRCESELKEQSETEKYSRLMREGEAESKNPRFSSSALAKWADAEHRTLMCPRCEITEKIFTTETQRHREL
jgi:hypothetical protein